MEDTYNQLKQWEWSNCVWIKRNMKLGYGSWENPVNVLRIKPRCYKKAMRDLFTDKIIILGSNSQEIKMTTKKLINNKNIGLHIYISKIKYMVIPRQDNHGETRSWELFIWKST